MAAKTPEFPLAHVARRPRQFKMRLTEDEATKLKTTAHTHELTQADYVRKVVFGATAHSLPDASKLEAIARQLAGIAANLNQCQHAINSAQQSDKLTANQFRAMHEAIAQGRKLWAAPLEELRLELRKLRTAE